VAFVEKQAYSGQLSRCGNAVHAIPPLPNVSHLRQLMNDRAYRVRVAPSGQAAEPRFELCVIKISRSDLECDHYELIFLLASRDRGAGLDSQVGMENFLSG
jgi:hypothetical protein